MPFYYILNTYKTVNNYNIIFGIWGIKKGNKGLSKAGLALGIVSITITFVYERMPTLYVVYRDKQGNSIEFKMGCIHTCMFSYFYLEKFLLTLNLDA